MILDSKMAVLERKSMDNLKTTNWQSWKGNRRFILDSKLAVLLERWTDDRRQNVGSPGKEIYGCS